MSTMGQRLRQLLLSVTSLAIGLGLAEIGIRLTPFGRPKLDLTPFFQYDRTLGWRTRPLAKGTIYDWEYTTYLEYNSHGMRGPERAYQKPADTFRILMLGDSQVDATMVETRDRVSETLERLLNDAHPAKHVEVMAMGAGAYSTDQELLWLESEGWKFSPDLVILMFFEDDVSGNGLPYFYGPKPQFLWDGQKLVLHNVPVPELGAGHHEHEQARWDMDKRFPAVHRWAESHSRLYRFFFVDWQRLTPLPPRSPLYSKPEPQDVRAAWDLTGALLARMKRDATERQSRLLVFYIPRREDVYHKDWAALESELHLRPEEWDMRRVTARFLAVCRQEALDCLDPTERFVEAASRSTQRNERLYNQYDTHWTVKGHRLAAEILSAKIAPELMSEAPGSALPKSKQ